MKDQLEALIMQMYKSGILYSEAVREFKKRFILTVSGREQRKSMQSRARVGNAPQHAEPHDHRVEA